jgi:hypothetical protein
MLGKEKNGPNVEPLRIVLDRARRAKKALGILSLSTIILAEVSPEIDAEIKREQLVLKGAPADIRELNGALSYHLFFTILVNSPLFAFIGLALVSMVDLFESVKRGYNTVTLKSWEAAAASNVKFAATVIAHS